MSPLLAFDCGAASVLLCLLVVSLQSAFFVTVARGPVFFRLTLRALQSRPSVWDGRSRNRVGNPGVPLQTELGEFERAASGTGSPTRGNAQKAEREEQPARLSVSGQAGARGRGW